MSTTSKHYRLNYQITSPTVRLLAEDGKQIGVVTKIEALQKAQELGLDIVEIAPNAKPPVAKLIDYKKFKYQEAKKEQESKKSQKNVGVKEIRLRPFIGAHDFDTRLKKTQEFLDEGNQVKVVVSFRGREILRKEFGFDVMKRFVGAVQEARIVREPKLEGRTIAAMIVSDKKKEHEKTEK